MGVITRKEKYTEKETKKKKEKMSGKLYILRLEKIQKLQHQKTSSFSFIHTFFAVS